MNPIDIVGGTLHYCKALHALMGGDRTWMRHFLTSENRVTRDIPAHQIETLNGLISVLNFVEALREKS